MTLRRRLAVSIVALKMSRPFSPLIRHGCQQGTNGVGIASSSANRPGP